MRGERVPLASERERCKIKYPLNVTNFFFHLWVNLDCQTYRYHHSFMVCCPESSAVHTIKLATVVEVVHA